MTYFAEVKDGKVTNVIIAEQEFINTLPNPNNWVLTLLKPKDLGFPGIGFNYGKGSNKFKSPKPLEFPSFIYDEILFSWGPSIPMPVVEGKKYNWDEASTSWKEII